jgi:hypothetical protein
VESAWTRILREQQQLLDGEIERRREFKATWPRLPVENHTHSIELK